MKNPVFLVSLVLLAAFAARAENPAATPAGLCYANTADNQRIIVPLESSEVVMTVTPGTVETELVQTFTNRTSLPLEAVYLYPLPPDATITHYELRYADRVIASVVREKHEARVTYEAAVAEGKKAALLEQHDPTLFSTKVANFMPGETVKVAVRFIQPVDIATDEVTVRFPMTTGRKYFPAGVTPGTPGVSAENPAQVDAPAMAAKHYYAFDIMLSGFPVRAVTSPSHRIAVTAAGGESQRVVLQEDITVPDRDFVLQIVLEARDQPRSTVTLQQTATGSYGVLTVFPPPARRLAKGAAEGRDILFLLDCSGSMEGTRLASLRLGVGACLQTLSPQDRFQLVFFDSNHEFYRDRWTSATPEEVAAAVQRVRALVVGSGTEMQPALSASLDFMAGSDGTARERCVFLLTDGDVGNADSLLSLVEKKIGRARLYTFGIGSAPNADLIQRMAELGQGQARFITDDNAVAKELADLFSSLDAPIMSDLHLVLRDASGTPIPAEIEPRQLGNVFARRPLQAVFATAGGWPAEVLLEGRREDEVVSTRLALAPTPLRGNGLEKRFGRLVYDGLAGERRRAGPGPAANEIGQRMRDIALRYQLVTEFTSRVAVEERISRDPSAPLGSVAVPMYRPGDAGSESVLELSPFEVAADEDNGYTAATTLAGARLHTELRDIGCAVTVVTSQFLKDIGATNTEGLLLYTANTESAMALPQGDTFAVTDGVPFATLSDPALIAQLTVRPANPDRIRLTQREATFRRQNLLTTRIGDEGYQAVTLDRAGPLGADKSLAGRVILTRSNETRPRGGVLLDLRKNLGDDRVEGTLQWQKLVGYGEARFAKASFQHDGGGNFMWGAGIGWHEIQRTDAGQFRRGSPTAAQDGLGFMNLDLLTSPADRLSDLSAQGDLYLAVPGTRQLHRAWLQVGWHRQEADWMTPAAFATGRRDNLGGVLDWSSASSDRRLSAGLRLGWTQHRGENQADAGARTGSTTATLTWEFSPGWRAFASVTNQEDLPWLSTGRFREDAGRWLVVTPRAAHLRSGQAGLRMNTPGERFTLETGLYRETVNDLSYRDWAWERDHGGAGATVLADGTLREPFSYGLWPELQREGWTGRIDFFPAPEFNLVVNWYVDWRNVAPYRGGNRRLSAFGCYTFRSGRWRGWGVGAGVSARNTLTFNDGHALTGGWRPDLLLKYERKLGSGRSALTQLNLGNLGGDSARPTRFAIDHGRQVVLSHTLEF